MYGNGPRSNSKSLDMQSGALRGPVYPIRRRVINSLATIYSHRMPLNRCCTWFFYHFFTTVDAQDNACILMSDTVTVVN